MQKNQTKKLYTTHEVAKLLGVTPQTLRTWEEKGELVPFRNPINNYRVYKINQIERFIEDMRNERLRRGKFRIKVKIIETGG